MGRGGKSRRQDKRVNPRSLLVAEFKLNSIYFWFRNATPGSPQGSALVELDLFLVPNPHPWFLGSAGNCWSSFSIFDF